MKTTPIRDQIYEFIKLYVDTPEPKKLCSSIEDLVEELAESKVKNLALSGVSQQRELLFAYEKMRTSHIIGATDEWRYLNVDLFISKL